MKHTCHAERCTKEVPRTMLMCRKHWFMVPPSMRIEVVKHYQRGQCDGKVRVSKEWVKAARAAIDEVARQEAAISGRA